MVPDANDSVKTSAVGFPSVHFAKSPKPSTPVLTPREITGSFRLEGDERGRGRDSNRHEIGSSRGAFAIRTDTKRCLTPRFTEKMGNVENSRPDSPGIQRLHRDFDFQTPPTPSLHPRILTKATAVLISLPLQPRIVRDSGIESELFAPAFEIQRRGIASISHEPRRASSYAGIRVYFETPLVPSTPAKR